MEKKSDNFVPKIGPKYGELNDKPFQHMARFGTEIKAKRCDFQGGYELFRPAHLTNEEFASDVAEIFHWHAMNICPDLNGYTFGTCQKVHIVD